MTWAIHGFTGSPAVWAGLEDIDSARCLTVLGHGPASVARGGESFAGEVSRLAALLPERCSHLVGYSLGARLALALALQDPTRIEKLTLIGVHPGLQSKAERSDRQRADQDWAQLLRNDGIEAFVDAWQALPLWKSQQALPPAGRAQQRMQRLQHDASQLAFALDALGTGSMPPMWNQLAQLTMPVQLIVGAQDQKYQALAMQMLPHLAQGEIEIIDAAGHNPVLENPQALARLLACQGLPARAAQ
jgi:2-succinyl-6-hydroxy-2,4-cyclohexadiene-1-carboxylate synthase